MYEVTVGKTDELPRINADCGNSGGEAGENAHAPNSIGKHLKRKRLIWMFLFWIPLLLALISVFSNVSVSDERILVFDGTEIRYSDSVTWEECDRLGRYLEKAGFTASFSVIAISNPAAAAMRQASSSSWSENW